MKLYVIFNLFLAFGFFSPKNAPVEHLDAKRYAGVWYSLSSIPTRWDKGTRETTGKYTWNPKGYFDVLTTCITEKGTQKSVSSKVFASDRENGDLKAQFLWPFKVDYWIIELPDDYSYVVVGHPDLKMLFIMSRKKEMSPTLYKAIVERCKAKGYDVGKLASQNHTAG